VRKWRIVGFRDHLRQSYPCRKQPGRRRAIRVVEKTATQVDQRRRRRRSKAVPRSPSTALVGSGTMLK
jgi:hypothetical protein